jgi:hypothetical protein
MLSLVVAAIYIVLLILCYQQSDVAEDTTYDRSAILLQRGLAYFIYDANNIDDTPLVFDDIYKYTAFVNAQHSLGISTPDIFIQEILGPQGDPIYKIRGNPFNPAVVDYKEGLEENKSTPYDRKIYMDNLAYNVSNALSVSQIKVLDKLELTKSILASNSIEKCQSTPEDIKPIVKNGLTADPMTPNWGGIAFTQQMVGEGYFAGNEIIRYSSETNRGLIPSRR